MEKFNKKSLVLGASTKPERYAYRAAQKLLEAGHTVCLVAKRKSELFGIHLYDEPVLFKNLDTVTLYLNPTNQKEYYNYLVDLKPRRVIFNPGTENRELVDLLSKNGIASEEACTLVLLSINSY